MSNKWTDEETNYLISNYSKNTYAEIAQVINKSADTIAAKVKRLGLSKRFKWTDERIIEFVELYNERYVYKDIASKLGCTEDIIKRRALKLIKEGVLEKRNDCIKNFGYNHNNIHTHKDKSTKVYLIYFPCEDFYKIGLTQRTLHERFRNYPEYLELDIVEMPLNEALLYEKSLLANVNKFRPSHEKFYKAAGGGSGGWTECFKSDLILESLNDCADTVVVK